MVFAVKLSQYRDFSVEKGRKMTKIDSRCPAQVKQDKLRFTLLIDGTEEWKSFLAGTIKFNTDNDQFWIKRCGSEEVTFLDYLRIEAEVNEVSFERCVMNALLRKGFVLQELEVEFLDEQRKMWGICTWYKDHPSYSEPLKEPFTPQAQKLSHFINARWRTEYSGDQAFGLFSMQMFGAAILGLPQHILLHKTLLYRKAAFTSPHTEVSAA